jgi:hypothetical protein
MYNELHAKLTVKSMSKTRDEFAELTALFDEFDIGEDPGENFTFSNPAGDWSPSNPNPTQETKQGRALVRYFSSREVQGAVQTGDASLLVRNDEYEGFTFSQNTTAVDDLGQHWSVIGVDRPPKYIITMIHVRPL